MDPEQTSLVSRYGANLDSRQRKSLKSLGHPLQPIVMVGQKGISENLLDNVEQALLHHELIKIKVHDTSLMAEAAEKVHAFTAAQLVQQIGKMLLFYRAHPDTPTIKI